MDATGNGWVSDAIRCFEYCLSKDTQVLSNSWGGVDYSKSLQVSHQHTFAKHRAPWFTRRQSWLPHSGVALLMAYRSEFKRGEQPVCINHFCPVGASPAVILFQ